MDALELVLSNERRRSPLLAGMDCLRLVLLVVVAMNRHPVWKKAPWVAKGWMMMEVTTTSMIFRENLLVEEAAVET